MPSPVRNRDNKGHGKTVQADCTMLGSAIADAAGRMLTSWAGLPDGARLGG